jgi:hypothetical protein
MPTDEGDWGDEPRREESADSGGEEVSGGYDMAPLPQDEAVKKAADKVGKENRRKRSRSLLKADEVPHPFTIRQGWLDGLYLSTVWPMTLAFCFFFFPLMIFVSLAAAITAHDAEARRNALMTIAFCFLPMFVLCCVGVIAKSMNPG